MSDLDDVKDPHTRWNCAKLRTGKSTFPVKRTAKVKIPAIIEFARCEVRHAVDHLHGRHRKSSMDECLGWALAIRDRELINYVLSHYPFTGPWKPDFTNVYAPIKTVFQSVYGLTLDKAWEELEVNKLIEREECAVARHNLSNQDIPKPTINQISV